MAEPISSAGNTVGLATRLTAGLCATFTLAGGIIFYFATKKGAFLRHWAVQSIFFGGAWLVFNIVITVLICIDQGLPGAWLRAWPALLQVVTPLLMLLHSAVQLVFFTFWIVGIIKALQGEWWEYPSPSLPGYPARKVE